MDRAKRQHIDRVVSTLRRELHLLEQTGDSLRVRVQSSPEHAERLRLLSTELKSLTLEDE